VLSQGETVPDVEVWTAPRQSPERLRDVLGNGLTLLCFYLFDWSPT
jgi:hypothetical protein